MFGFHERDTCSLLPSPCQAHAYPSYSNQRQPAKDKHEVNLWIGLVCNGSISLRQTEGIRRDRAYGIMMKPLRRGYTDRTNGAPTMACQRASCHVGQRDAAAA